MSDEELLVAEDTGAEEETQADAPEQSADNQLTELERGVLAIEKKRWRYQGSKEQAIVKELGINATRYYQILSALLEDPRALQEEPLLMKRLQAKLEQTA